MIGVFYVFRADSCRRRNFSTTSDSITSFRSKHTAKNSSADILLFTKSFTKTKGNHCMNAELLFVRSSNPNKQLARYTTLTWQSAQVSRQKWNVWPENWKRHAFSPGRKALLPFAYCPQSHAIFVFIVTVENFDDRERVFCGDPAV